MKWLLVPLAAYVVVAALMYFGQRSMLYLPGKNTATTTQLQAFGLQKWPDSGRYLGYLHDPDDAVATVVVFHGNAGDAIDRRYYLDALGFSEARILLAEYPGYGGRAGRPTEDALMANARETLARLRETYPQQPLYAIGESLGAGVVAGAAMEGRSAMTDGILLLTPWNTLTELAAYHYPWLPVRWFLRDRYPSADNVADFPAMKIVVVAERDEIVPARFGRALFDALKEPKALFVVDDARHNDWFAYVDEAWWRTVWSRLHAQ